MIAELLESTVAQKTVEQEMKNATVLLGHGRDHTWSKPQEGSNILQMYNYSDEWAINMIVYQCCFLWGLPHEKMSETSIKNHFYKMNRDIGMADYEKQVKQEFHTPSLYLCFFMCPPWSHFIQQHPVMHQLQNKDIGMGYGTLVSLVFHNLPSLYPCSFCRNDFLYLFHNI